MRASACTCAVTHDGVGRPVGRFPPPGGCPKHPTREPAPERISQATLDYVASRSEGVAEFVEALLGPEAAADYRRATDPGGKP